MDYQITLYKGPQIISCFYATAKEAKSIQRMVNNKLTKRLIPGAAVILKKLTK